MFRTKTAGEGQGENDLTARALPSRERREEEMAWAAEVGSLSPLTTSLLQKQTKRHDTKKPPYHEED